MTLTLIVITLLAVASAAVFARIAWRLVDQERRRSAARVAGLAAAIDESRSTPASEIDATPVPVGQLFDAAAAPARRTAWIALSGAVAAGLVLGVVLSLGHGSETTPAPSTVPAESSAPGRDLPLELVALGDERHDETLTIRGIVRNPARGSEVTHVTAVIMLFNSQGGFLTSGRASLEREALEPGNESSFAVTIPGATDGGRYRVSFRDDVRVIPHVDRRAS